MLMLLQPPCTVGSQRSTHVTWSSMRSARGAELARALALAPNNPRVLWVVGGYFLFLPATLGGDRARALVAYRQAADSPPPAAGARSPMPDWGRPEALMALAYAHLHAASPDLEAAAQEAAAALSLVPDWAYVRDVLVPQIRAAATQPRPEK
jgi:hypothetical protein